MSDVTRILERIERGETQAADELLPLVYDELRRLARQMMAQEKPGQTLQPTALVHEVYLRLAGEPARTQDESDTGGGRELSFANRRHFFAVAAEAMRRILVESARRKRTLKRGGQLRRLDLADVDLAAGGVNVEILALDEALGRLAQEDPRCARLVELRYFGGLTIEQAAQVLGVSTRTAKRDWTYSRTWLRRLLRPDSETK